MVALLGLALCIQLVELEMIPFPSSPSGPLADTFANPVALPNSVCLLAAEVSYFPAH